MRSWLATAVIAIVVLGLIVAGLVYFVFWDQFVPIAAMGINYVRYMNAPAGTIADRSQPSLEGGSGGRPPRFGSAG